MFKVNHNVALRCVFLFTKALQVLSIALTEDLILIRSYNFLPAASQSYFVQESSLPSLV